MYTVQGRWNQEGERWTNWCEGFFPGILWLLHKQTGEAEWRALAEQYSRPLEPRRFDRDVHDLGFLFFSTYLRWYRLSQVQSALGNSEEQHKALTKYRELHDKELQREGLEPVFSPREITKQELDPKERQ